MRVDVPEASVGIVVSGTGSVRDTFKDLDGYYDVGKEKSRSCMN